MSVSHFINLNKKLCPNQYTHICTITTVTITNALCNVVNRIACTPVTVCR